MEGIQTFEDCALLALHENLSQEEVDPNGLIAILEENREIGMSNFKSKVKTPPKKKNYRLLWKKSARKLKLLDDPWHQFRIEDYPVENVVRHRYNPAKKEWHKDNCVVKMEKYSFLIYS